MSDKVIPAPVKLAALTTLCFALFVILAWYVTGHGASNVFDTAVSAWLQALRSPPLDLLMLVATYLCSWPIVIAGAIASVVYWAFSRAWAQIVSLALALAGNGLLNSVVKEMVRRVRPDQAKALLPASGPSFPSGHTFSAFALYGLCAYFLYITLRSPAAKATTATAAVVFIALVGISRIYLGAHWPTDVLGSCLLGTAWLGFIATFVARRRIEPPGTLARSPGVVLVCGWLAFIIAYAWVHPITENAGSIGEKPVSAVLGATN